MSLDASDAMGGGESDHSEAATVTLDDLDDDQLDTYETLIERGARYVRDGVMGVGDCSLSPLLEDGEEASEALVDAFHRAIEAQVDDLAESPTERREQQEQQTTTTDPQKIDWDRVWEECNIPPKKPLSGTQLALAIDVSDQTPVTDGGAERLVAGAVEAGLLESFPSKHRYAPAGSDGR